jgi:hypothetical protein
MRLGRSWLWVRGVACATLLAACGSEAEGEHDGAAGQGSGGDGGGAGGSDADSAAEGGADSMTSAGGAGELASAGVAGTDGSGGEATVDGALTPCLREWRTPTSSNWNFDASSPIPTAPSGRSVIADGDIGTVWVTPIPRAAGMWFSLRFIDGDLTLGRLELEVLPENDANLPETLQVELDGKLVPATFERELGLLRVSFEPTDTSQTQLTLTEASGAPWSIAELRAFCR